MSVYEKNGKWYYQFMIFGKRKHGACRGCKDISHALEYEADMKNQISLMQRNKIDESEVITLKEMFSLYDVYSKTNHTPFDYNLHKRKAEIIKEFFGEDTIIKDVTPDKIEKFKKYLISDKKLSNASFNRYYGVLSKAFNLIILNKKLQFINPCKYVSKLKENNYILRYLTEEEEERLFKHLAPHLKPIVVCALTTGLRKSNILNLKWENINFDVGFIEILKQDNKGHKKIQIPLSSKFKTELEKIGIKKSGYVFVNPKTNAPYKSIKTAFNNALDNAGIENFRFHDLRHTVGTRLVANGADLQTVKEYLAHSEISTTQRYLHPVKENMKKAVDILDSF